MKNESPWNQGGFRAQEEGKIWEGATTRSPLPFFQVQPFQNLWLGIQQKPFSILPASKIQILSPGWMPTSGYPRVSWIQADSILWSTVLLQSLIKTGKFPLPYFSSAFL